MSKQPYIPLYTGDYLKDTRSLTLAAKGAWVDLLVFMWEAQPRGVLKGTIADFARMIGTDPETFASILLELSLKRICEREDIAPDIIVLTNRRMIRETAISEARRTSGSKGGKKTQAFAKAKQQAKNKQNTDIDIDNDTDNEVELLSKKESEISLDFQSVRDALFGDERWLEGITMAYRGLDPDQALKECFLHHSQTPVPPRELWQWRQKFNTWLSIKSNSTINGKQTRSNRKTDYLADLAEDFARRHGS